ncbi:translation initiation factor [Hydrogenimonas urashimensis]|uniref:translation initiation factor n=1 Tax=Hydrogenimonas urashimensis TaxID=2740515 RepID=UPI001F1A3C8A|nr:translation initiation factor [Hydrogenimonas urashimensis]
MKLDIEFGSFDEGWKADNRAKEAKEQSETLPPHEHRLVFRREKRRGKPVTLVGEFYLEKSDAHALLAKIKKSLGSGGTFKRGWIQLQGEQADALRNILKALGYRFK